MTAVLQINAPGVPALLGGIAIPLPTLLTADLVTAGAIPEQWGVYLGGVPAVTFTTFISVDYRRGWALSDYPVERGGFETFDKVQLPFDVRVRFGAGENEANRVKLLTTAENVGQSLQLYDVVTPEKIYTSVNVQHIDYHRTATNGRGLIVVEMWLLEVRTTFSDQTQDNTGINGQPVDINGNAITPATDGSNVGTDALTAAGSNVVDGGNVAPLAPTDATVSGFDATVIEGSSGGGGGF